MGAVGTGDCGLYRRTNLGNDLSLKERRVLLNGKRQLFARVRYYNFTPVALHINRGTLRRLAESFGAKLIL
jgi:hypothetical protein